MIDDRIAYLDAEFEAGTNYLPNKADWLEGKWSGMAAAHGDERRGDTAVNLEELQKIGAVMTNPPEHLNLNSKLNRILKARASAIISGRALIGPLLNIWRLDPFYWRAILSACLGKIWPRDFQSATFSFCGSRD